MFKSLKSGLAKVFANQKIDQNTIQDFEDLLITSDVDVETSELITTKLTYMLVLHTATSQLPVKFSVVTLTDYLTLANND